MMRRFNWHRMTTFYFGIGEASSRCQLVDKGDATVRRDGQTADVAAGQRSKLAQLALREIVLKELARRIAVGHRD